MSLFTNPITLWAQRADTRHQFTTYVFSDEKLIFVPAQAIAYFSGQGNTQTSLLELGSCSKASSCQLQIACSFSYSLRFASIKQHCCCGPLISPFQLVWSDRRTNHHSEPLVVFSYITLYHASARHQWQLRQPPGDSPDLAQTRKHFFLIHFIRL